jgi:hypothetical protein
MRIFLYFTSIVFYVIANVFKLLKVVADWESSGWI